MNKRGLMMSFLIAVIVLVVTLAVLIFLVSKLNTKENIEIQGCRASVEARSTFNFGNVIELGRDFIPLNCHTEKICISNSEDNCEKVQGFKSTEENKIKKEKIKNSEGAKEKVLDVISQNLYDCQFQLGQGKLNFMPSRTFSRNYCLICDRIVLDEQTREEAKDITWVEIYTHMQGKKDKDGINYLKYVYEADSLQELLPELEKVKNAAERELKVRFEIGDLKPAGLTSSDGTAIMVQVSTPGNLINKLGLVTGVTLGAGGTIAMIIAPFTGGASLFVFGAIATVTGAGGTYFGAEADTGTILGDTNIALASGPIFISSIPGGIDYARPTLYTYDAEFLSKLGCTSFELAPKFG